MFTADVRTICWRQVVAARSLISCQNSKRNSFLRRFCFTPPLRRKKKNRQKVSDLHQSVLATSKSVYWKDRKVHLPLMERKYNFR